MEPKVSPTELTENLTKVANYARGPFAPHGTMEVFQQGAVIRTQVTGPFNKEFITAFGKMWASLFAQWNGQGKLVIVSRWQGSMLASPETVQSYKILNERSAHMLPAGTLQVWQVPKDIEGRSMMLPKWLDAVSVYQEALQICGNEGEVEAIIQRELATLD